MLACLTDGFLFGRRIGNGYSEQTIATPVGEIGLLEEVQRSNIDPNACFLTMNHAGASYVGRLHFDREGCCGLLCDLLPHHYGQSLQEIGEMIFPSVLASIRPQSYLYLDSRQPNCSATYLK